LTGTPGPRCLSTKPTNRDCTLLTGDKLRSQCTSKASSLAGNSMSILHNIHVTCAPSDQCPGGGAVFVCIQTLTMYCAAWNSEAMIPVEHRLSMPLRVHLMWRCTVSRE
jgi:hypothetical protein